VITSKSGKEIVVNKVKVEDKEKILKRGQVSLYLPVLKLRDTDLADAKVIHERLEREIHPEEILVVTETREDVWGLRYVFLMFICVKVGTR
jgi:exonuclease V